MSEHYEPSYYEIALTGRQVLAAFVILLVCLVSAFFSGVWVGRGGTGEGEAGATEVVADAAPRDGGADAEAPDPDGDLEELSFFQGDGETASGGAPREGSGPEGMDDAAASPRREPAGSGGAAAETEPPASAGPRNGPSDPPEPSPGRDGGAPGRESGSATGEPPPQPAPPPADASPSRSLATGDIVVQVFSSSEEDKARNVLDRLRENDFRAFLSPVADGERTLYRVRVGPFEHMDEARAVADRLRESLGLETWITQ